MKVIVEEVQSYSEVRRFVDEVLQNFRIKEKFLLLKPNFLKFDDPQNGCITHPDVVKAVAEVLKTEKDVVIAEGGFFSDSADKCFEAFGLKNFAECVNLNKDEFVEISINGKALKSAPVAKKAIGKSFVSMPKMKVHHLTKVTLGIKNNMGFLKKPAIYMHPNIHQKLVDLLSIFQPKLTIVDGIIGGEGSEMSPKPINHGVMVASDNVVAADYVSLNLMGFSLQEVEHVSLAMAERGIKAEDIKIEGELDKLKQSYRLSFFSRLIGETQNAVFRLFS